MKKIAIFASGGGSNGQKIYDFFQNNAEVEITCIVVNNPKAGVIEKAKLWGVPVVFIDKKSFIESKEVVEQLQNLNIDLIVLAGFLWLIPSSLLDAFPQRIINIHPALLPKYGGQGMYGINVHRAVLAAGEKESGITIHTIDEEYDRGDFIFQKSVNIEHCRTAEEIAATVLSLEHHYFPQVINDYLFND